MLALLLQVFYSIRSERQPMEQLAFNLLFRWFVGLGIDERVSDATVFTKNRERLLAGEVASRFLARLIVQPAVTWLLSRDHFSVNGTLIEAWASIKSASSIVRSAASLRRVLWGEFPDLAGVGSEEAPRRAGLRPPLKRPVRFSRKPLSRRFGSMVTNPSASSCQIASRTGIRLTPNRLAKCSCPSDESGANTPETMPSRSASNIAVAGEARSAG